MSSAKAPSPSVSGDGWRTLLRPADWGVLVLALGLCLLLTPYAFRGGIADRVQVRSDGRVVAELDIHSRHALTVPGPLGETRIVIEPGRARVLSDPGMHQYCVRQGWLHRPGEIAICAPNRVSLQILGRTPLYDSINY